MDTLQLLLNFIGAIGIGGFLGSLVTLYVGAKLRKEEIVFTTLHAKRAEVIAELYKRLRVAEESFMKTAINYEEPGSISIEMRITHSLQAATNFLSFYNDNRIYFDESLTKYIDDFLQPFEDLVFDLAEVKGTKTRDFEAVKDKFDQLIQPLSKKIQNEFQKLIGMRDTPKKFRWFEPDAE